MKRQTVGILSLIAVIVICLCAFFGLAFLYLALDYKSSASSEKASGTVENIPYTSVSESVTVKYIFSDGTSALLKLDFSSEKLTAFLSYENISEPDYELQPLSGAAAGFIDRLGGVELQFENRVLRYTGEQAVRLTENGTVSKKDILRAVFDKIALSGITRSQLTFLLQNSKTQLTVPICYSWPEWLKEICARAEIYE